MRHVKMAMGIAAAVCAFGAASVTAASAHTFKVSKLSGVPITPATPAPTAGRGEGESSFKFGGIKIHCGTAKAKGTVSSYEFKEFASEVHYSECFTEVKFGKEEVAQVKTKIPAVTYVFHANGFVETGTETEEEEGEVHISGGEVAVVLTGLKCVVNWPAQTVPTKAIKQPEGEFGAASYANEEVANPKMKLFPSGFQKKVVVSTELKKMEYSVEGGACESFGKTEGHSGLQSGTLTEEVKSGNISYE